jgi:hypothetical protein
MAPPKPTSGVKNINRVLGQLMGRELDFIDNQALNDFICSNISHKGGA